MLKEGVGQPGDEGADEDMPLLLKYRLPGLDDIEDEDEKFRFDIQSRPEETSQSGYDMVPVEKFGEAMLRGMMWKPGDPIGSTNKAVVKPIEYIARHHRLGLGATPKEAEPSKKKYIKPGESRKPKQMMVLPRDKDGRQRHVRDLDQKLVPYRPEGIYPGNLAGVVSGQHEGMFARVVQLGAGGKVRIRFGSEEEVTVDRTDLVPLHSTQLKKGHPALNIREGLGQEQMEEEAEEGEGEGSQQEADSTANGDANHKTQEGTKEKHKQCKGKREEKKEPVWLRPGITVRIVSKSLGEKFYRKKVKVVDVVAGDTCTLMLESGKMIENVRQRQVETVIPSVGGRVVVVLGPDRGKIGKILQKSTSKESAVVQFEGDRAGELGTFHLDDISELKENNEYYS